MSIQYDVIWYWKGGREIGKWFPIGVWENSFNMKGYIKRECIKLDRVGYVNHPGKLSIGPPEEPPTDEEFKALGL